jgi:hypothetical protein
VTTALGAGVEITRVAWTAILLGAPMIRLNAAAATMATEAAIVTYV